MYTVFISFLHSSPTAVLTYKTEKAARTAMLRITEARQKKAVFLPLKDDYNHEIPLPVANICFHMLTDVKKEIDMGNERKYLMTKPAGMA